MIKIPLRIIILAFSFDLLFVSSKLVFDVSIPIPRYNKYMVPNKELILNGKLKANDKLPSTRELSINLNIERNVVIDCYEQLMAEGYVYTKSGSGTYICEGVTFPKIKIRTEAHFNKGDNYIEKISFRTGIPDLDNIPINKLVKGIRSLADVM